MAIDISLTFQKQIYFSNKSISGLDTLKNILPVIKHNTKKKIFLTF